VFHNIYQLIQSISFYFVAFHFVAFDVLGNEETMLQSGYTT